MFSYLQYPELFMYKYLTTQTVFERTLIMRGTIYVGITYVWHNLCEELLFGHSFHIVR